MNQLLQGWSPYLTYAVWGAVGLAIIIGFGLIIVTSLALKRAAKRRALAPPTPQDETPDEKLSLTERMHKTWIGFLKFWGLQASDTIAESFDKTIEILKTYIPGKDFRYEIPWYMVVGAEDSGKTELLKNLNLELPIGRPDLDSASENTACNWWFFDRGIVLDVAGNLVLGKNDVHSDEKSWKYLLNQIMKHRPKRPLDGIILTIPITELIGPEVLNQDEIIERGKKLHRKLWLLQSNLMMKVPVYVVFTKADALPGFTEMVQELPDHRLHEIFGWSCPYALDVSYSQQWGYDLFIHLKQSLQKLRGLVFTQNAGNAKRDMSFLLNMSFERIEKNLGLYLDTIFQDSAYHESFFLRGAFFTGDAYTPASLKALNKNSSQDIVDPTQQNIPQRAPISDRTIVFINHLFEHKIFREGDLAQPILHILVSSSRALNFAKTAVGGLCLSWFIGLLVVSNDLSLTYKLARPLLSQIQRATEGIAQLQGPHKKAQREIYLNDQTTVILDKMGDISKARTWSIFIPASWFSGLDQAINEALTVAYDHIILSAIYNELLKKGEGVISLARLEDDYDPSSKYSLNPLELPAFKNLQSYIAHLKEFERHVSLYNHIESSQNIDDVLKLIRYIYDRDLPKHLFHNKAYYRTSLARTEDLNIYVQKLKSKASDKLKDRFESFMKAAFNLDQNAPLLIKLKADMDALARPGSKLLDDKDIRALVMNIKAVMLQITSPDLKWIEQTAFNPGDSYANLMTDVASSEILGVALASEMTQHVAESFENFKRLLQSMKTPLSQNIFMNVKGIVRADASDTFRAFLKILEDFTKQPFMTEDLIVQDIKPVPPQKMLFWDAITLQNAEKLVDDYNNFVDNTLVELPGEFRTILRFVGLNSLHKKVINIIAKSQSFQDAPAQFMSFSMREFLNSQVQNVKLVTSQFRKILSIFSMNDINFKKTGLSELLTSQIYGLLRQVDKMLDSENLFGVRDSNFDWWEGGINSGLKAFAADDQEGLETFLTAQIQRTSYYAKDLAQYLLNFLRVANLENTPSDPGILNRWSRILTQIDYYTQKKPGNSVAVLEEYVIKTMNQTNVANCGRLNIDGTGDYFLERRSKIQTLQYKRCTKLSKAQFNDRYNRIATFFNTNLAERFPFSSKKYIPQDREATLRDVQTFYKLMDLLSPYDYEVLASDAKKSPLKARILGFLRSIKASRRLLRADGNSMEGADDDGVHLSVELSNRKKLETQNNFVLKRYLRIGDPTAGADGMTTIKNGDQVKELDYFSGDEVQMQFDFVKSNEATKYPSPVTDFARPAYEVQDGNKLVIIYSGPWALLHALKEHKAEEVNPPTGVERQWTLKIDIPIQFPDTAPVPGAEQPAQGAEVKLNGGQKGTTTILYDVKLMQKKGEEGAPLTGAATEKALMNRSLASLNFPTSAPVLKLDEEPHEDSDGSGSHETTDDEDSADEGGNAA